MSRKRALVEVGKLNERIFCLKIFLTKLWEKLQNFILMALLSFISEDTDRGEGVI